MISKLKGIVLVVILSLASIMMPFNVYADTISSTNVVGLNVELLGSTTLEHREDQGNNYYYKQYSYKAVIELDNSYVGVIGARVQGNYYEKAPVQGSQLLTQAFNYYRKIYVNGNSAEMTFVISTWYSSVQDPINYRSDGTSPSVTIEDSNVSKYEDLDSIEQIIDLLTDIYQNSNDIEGLSTNQLLELQNIVSNTSLANQYLEKLTLIKDWNIPIESWPIVFNRLASQTSSLIDSFKINNNIQMPCFDVPVNGALAYQIYMSANLEYKFIFYLASNGTTSNLTISNQNVSVLSKQTFDEINTGGFNANFAYLRRYEFKLKSTVNGYTNVYSTVGRSLYIPIYFGPSSNNRISTDFALLFGLSNQLLDDVHKIAQGTAQSNSAASDLETEASEYSDIADDVIGVEEGLTSNFESSVNQIDLNTGLNGFGGNFMTSATWVRTQFDRLTENTPYGSLVVYGLTLGFVLLMLGKVLL